MAARAWRLVGAGAVLLAGLAAVGAGWLVYQLQDSAELAEYAGHVLAPAPAEADGRRVTVAFLGVASVLIDDGETALMTDGFFTRPGKLAVALQRIAPDREAIDAGLRRAGVDRLAAVLVVHSHYDHAMDAPEVARRTGALLVGSPSTANVARGWGLDGGRIHVVRAGEPMRFGAFTVTMLASRHFPHGMAMGEIEAPLVPPVPAMEYLEGGSYSVLVEHPLGSLLVQGSAGWLEGALAGRRADVVLLGIGALGGADDAYRDTYYREVVEAVGPRCVIPIHFDDFTRPLDEPLRPMPRLLDDVGASLRFLRQRVAAQPQVGLGLLPEWTPVALLGSGAVHCRRPGPG